MTKKKLGFHDNIIKKCHACQRGLMVKARATEQKCGSGSGFESRSRRDVGRGGIVVVSEFCAVRSTVRFSLAAAACHRGSASGRG